MPPRRRSIRLLALAEQDLVDICEYVAVDNPPAAARLLKRMEKGLSALATQPLMGRTPRDPDIQRLGYRYVIIGEYLVFYRLESSVVLVHRILHGARKYSDII